MKFFSVARRLLPEFGLLLGGIGLGVGLAYMIAHEVRLQEGRAELKTYAQLLVEAADELGVENNQAIDAVTHDNLPFCSEQEIAFMRDYVFHSPHIRDIGRTKDGMLYCSAGLGKLAQPKATSAPDIATGGLKLNLRAQSLISANTKWFVVEKNDVTLILNPEAIQNFERTAEVFQRFPLRPANPKFETDLRATHSAERGRGGRWRSYRAQRHSLSAALLANLDGLPGCRRIPQ